MIYDKLKHLSLYKGMSGNLDTAIDYLIHTDITALPIGRTVVSGEDVFINVMDAQLKNCDEAAFEAHRKYADLQISLSGGEKIGWLPLCKLPEIAEQDNNPLFRDFHGHADVMLPLEPDRFVILFPQDGHAPCIGEGISHKLVVKIKVF